jgi:hypothetical protein
VTAGTRPALFFTVGVVFVGSLLSLLMPSAAPIPAPATPRISAGAEPFEAFEPIDPAAAALE